MSVYIDEGELLAGNQASAVRAATIFPENVTSWILQELDGFDKRPGDAFYAKEDRKSLLRELLKWWDGKT
ncbi:MAG TPA: pyruvate formate lyase family protein [Bacteroidales bacterium]|jgi:formate C-acetyltransferase|nr:pyruvate formate lyase family protein [Bacteroidales bacterium]